jgi:hypothetical protein
MRLEHDRLGRLPLGTGILLVGSLAPTSRSAGEQSNETNDHGASHAADSGSAPAGPKTPADKPGSGDDEPEERQD